MVLVESLKLMMSAITATKGHWANKCKKREADEKKNGLANLAVDSLQELGT